MDNSKQEDSYNSKYFPRTFLKPSQNAFVKQVFGISIVLDSRAVCAMLLFGFLRYTINCKIKVLLEGEHSWGFFPFCLSSCKK